MFFLGAGQRILISISSLVIFCWFIYVAGMRPFDAGGDTARYIEAYSEISSFIGAREVGGAIYGNTEILWWPVQYVYKFFEVSERLWLVINCIWIFVLTYFSYRKLCWGGFALIFSFVFLTYFSVYAGNAMRQALAFPIGLLSVCFLYERRYLLYFLLCFISVGLHWSSLAFVAFLFFKVLPNNRFTYLVLPIFSFMCSWALEPSLRLFVDIVGLPELRVKLDLYFDRGRESHVGAVWETFNFWICLLGSFAYLVLFRSGRGSSRALASYVSGFLSIILFGVFNPDFSERYFPAVLLVYPLLMASILARFKIGSDLRLSLFMLFFLVLGISVFISQSARDTLGYTFF